MVEDMNNHAVGKVTQSDISLEPPKVAAEICVSADALFQRIDWFAEKQVVSC